jgi:asparagine synthase (glutamine-hydrolysing)
MDGRDIQYWAARLAAAMEESVAALLGRADRAAVAFSGGLDSTLVAHLVLRRLENTVLYTVGMPGAKDIARSKKTAAALGMAGRHVTIELEERDVLDAAASIRALLPDCGRLETSFLLPSYMVFLRCGEKSVFTGDGADELFGGYSRYLSMDEGTLAACLHADTDRLLGAGIARNRTLASSANKELMTPLLSENVVALAGEIPPAMKVCGGVRKVVLRRAAEIAGIPPDISGIPKTAAQYGSSVAKVLKRHDA